MKNVVMFRHILSILLIFAMLTLSTGQFIPQYGGFGAFPPYGLANRKYDLLYPFDVKDTCRS